MLKKGKNLLKVGGWGGRITHTGSSSFVEALALNFATTPTPFYRNSDKHLSLLSSSRQFLYLSHYAPLLLTLPRILLVCTHGRLLYGVFDKLDDEM